MRIASWDEDVVVAWVLIEMEGDVAAPERPVDVLAANEAMAAGTGAEAEAETETEVLVVVVDAVGVVDVVVAVAAVVAAGVVAEIGVGGRCARLALRASVGRRVGSMAGRWGRWMGIE